MLYISMKSTSPVAQEAYLTERGTFNSFSHILKAVVGYVSERRDLRYNVTISGTGSENLEGEISVYPMNGAGDVLDVTDEISNRLGMDVQFRMRPRTERN
jgi:hypothetical protein